MARRVRSSLHELARQTSTRPSSIAPVHSTATPPGAHEGATITTGWLVGRSSHSSAAAPHRTPRSALLAPLLQRGLCAQAAAGNPPGGGSASCPACAAPVLHSHIFCGACERILPPPDRKQLNLFALLELCVKAPRATPTPRLSVVRVRRQLTESQLSTTHTLALSSPGSYTSNERA
jgi:hypothetical protein